MSIPIIIGPRSEGYYQYPGIRVASSITWESGEDVSKRYRFWPARLVKTCSPHAYEMTADTVGLATDRNRGAGRGAVPGQGITLTLTADDTSVFAYLQPREAEMLADALIAAASEAA